MIGFFIGLALLCCFCWLGFRITGALLGMALWVFVKLPLSILFGMMGIVLCMTIILFPVGRGCFRIAGHLLT